MEERQRLGQADLLALLVAEFRARQHLTKSSLVIEPHRLHRFGAQNEARPQKTPHESANLPGGTLESARRV